MAHVGQDQKAGVWDRRCDIFGVCALDRLVVVAVNDDNGRVDRLELRVGPVRLVGPHLADLIDEGVVLLRRRRMLDIFMASAILTLQASAPAEVKQYFGIEADGSFWLDVLMTETVAG